MRLSRMTLIFSALVAVVLINPLNSAIAEEPVPTLTRERASAFAKLALKGLSKEYPNKMDHVMAAPLDVQNPKALHPSFYGCYDWHSSVHGHWMLVRLLRLFPELPDSTEIRSVLGSHFTDQNLKAEADYFARKESKPFERPYGWAWLLKLAEELNSWDDPDAKVWAKNLKPLADVIVATLYRLLPEANLSDPHWRSPQHRVWALVRI